MLLQTFWYQIFENRTKTELLRHDSLNYSCKCKPTFGHPPGEPKVGLHLIFHGFWGTLTIPSIFMYIFRIDNAFPNILVPII